LKEGAVRRPAVNILDVESPMLKKILAILVMLYAAAAFAAVDVNKATAAELDGIKGIGPSISKAIVDERKKGDFKNWEDLITRVKGIGEGNAAKFSAEGLTVKGDHYKKAAESKKDDKKAAKEEKKQAKAETKSDKKETKAEAKTDKKEAKAEAKSDKKEDKTAAAKPAAATEKPAASAAKPAASAAKPAASAAKK
jgi:competence protein ComEA